MPVGFVYFYVGYVTSVTPYFSALTCYHNNMITYKIVFVNPHSYIGEISAFATKSLWENLLNCINYLL